MVVVAIRCEDKDGGGQWRKMGESGFSLWQHKNAWNPGGQAGGSFWRRLCASGLSHPLPTVLPYPIKQPWLHAGMRENLTCLKACMPLNIYLPYPPHGVSLPPPPSPHLPLPFYYLPPSPPPPSYTAPYPCVCLFLPSQHFCALHKRNSSLREVRPLLLL